MKSCCFIGHKICPAEIKSVLIQTIEMLITKHNVHTFYVGTQGGFDKMVYEVLCECEKRYGIQPIVVLAYLNRKAEMIYYDMQKSIFPDELTKVPIRFAIRRRNTFMIDRSEYVVTYLNTPFTNTFGNVEEAVRKKKQIINLGVYDIGKIIV